MLVYAMREWNEGDLENKAGQIAERIQILKQFFHRVCDLRIARPLLLQRILKQTTNTFKLTQKEQLKKKKHAEISSKS